MGVDKPNVHRTIGIVDPSDQSILITCNIENRTSIFDDVGVSEVVSHLLNQGGFEIVELHGCE